IMSSLTDHRACVSPLHGSPEAALRKWRMSSYSTCKAAIDVTVAGALLVLTSPLLLVAMVLVKLSSLGPMIYPQKRAGRSRRVFRMYRVRWMVHDCESDTGPQWAKDRDPRVTPIGRILRRTHVDELPQLWNVLRGEMSLVGPRPERPVFVTQLERA